MRLFIAVDVDERVVEKLKPLLKTLSSYRGVKAVESENVHITLQFLGEVPESRVDVISDRLSRITGNFEPFTVKLEKIGYFPNKSKVRVVWAGVSGETLKELAGTIRNEMKKLGFREDKEFVAHATIARIKRISPSDRERLLKDLENFSVGGEWVVRDIRLKQSRLTPKGPIYSDVSIHKLG